MYTPNHTKEELQILVVMLENSGYSVASGLILDAIEDGSLENGLRGSIGAAILIRDLGTLAPQVLQMMNTAEEELPLYLSTDGIERPVAIWRLNLMNGLVS